MPSSSHFRPIERLKSRLRQQRTSQSPNPAPEDPQDGAPTSYADDSEESEPPLTPLTLSGYRETTKRKLMTPDLSEELRVHIPSVLQIRHSWTLLYSLEQNGTSLNTLYDNCTPRVGESQSRRKGYFVVVMDGNKDRFGAYVNEYLHPQDGKHYYGNGDCFLWKCEYAKVMRLQRKPSGQVENLIDLDDDDDQQDAYDQQLRLRVFPYTGANDFIIYSNHSFISVGSGSGKFGLWIDSSFNHGASDAVDTFGNEQLSKDEKFSILGLEIWKVE